MGRAPASLANFWERRAKRDRASMRFPMVGPVSASRGSEQRQDDRGTDRTVGLIDGPKSGRRRETGRSTRRFDEHFTLSGDGE